MTDKRPQQMYMLGQGDKIVRAYGITILVTFVGTVASMLLTILMAYPLSRKDLPFRNAFAFYVFFTMLFNGGGISSSSTTGKKTHILKHIIKHVLHTGLVPTYIMWTRYLGIKNTIWALIIPSLLLNAFYIIMMRTY